MHERVLTCHPWPHVREHTLHCDHSSAAGSPDQRGDQLSTAQHANVPDGKQTKRTFSLNMTTSASAVQGK